MMILAQDKSCLINEYQISMICIDENKIVAIQKNDMGYELGTYADKNRAQDVLYDIIEAYETDENYKMVFEMPLE